MKKSALVICFILLLSFGTITAQTGTPDIMFLWGPNMPMLPSEFSDYWLPSWWNITFGAEYPLSGAISFVGRAHYHKFSFDRDSFQADYGNAGLAADTRRGKLKTAHITANLKYQFPFSGNIEGFVLGGGGVGRFLASDLDFYEAETMKAESWVSTGAKRTAAILQAGFGFGFRQSDNAFLFFEVTYEFVFTPLENTAFLPIKFGYQFKM